MDLDVNRVNVDPRDVRKFLEENYGEEYDGELVLGVGLRGDAASPASDTYPGQEPNDQPNELLPKDNLGITISVYKVPDGRDAEDESERLESKGATAVRSHVSENSEIATTDSVAYNSPELSSKYSDRGSNDVEWVDVRWTDDSFDSRIEL